MYFTDGNLRRYEKLMQETPFSKEKMQMKKSNNNKFKYKLSDLDCKL